MALHEVQLKGYSVRPGNLSLGTFDSYGIEQLHVTADDSWDGLNILAVFHAPNGDAKKVVVGADGMLNVPPEATAKQAGNGRIVFVGLAENVQRITVDMGYNIKTHSDIEGDNPGVPTPDVVQQILDNSNHAVSIATAAQVSAENARLAAEDAAKKAGEEAGGAAYSAAAAKKSAEDAAASSKIAASKAEASASSANVANESAKASQAAQSSAENSAQSAAKSARAAADSAASIVGDQEQSAASADAARNFAQQAKKASDSAAASASASKEAATQARESNTSAANSAADAEAAKTAAAESATAAAKSAADADNTANSIKDSMTQIAANKEAVSQLKEDTAALHKRQNVLVGSETGNPVSCDDAFAAPLCGLNVYGKSTQDGTPSPDNPVPIVSAGDGGTIAVKMTGKNLFHEQGFQQFFINNSADVVGTAPGNVSSILQVATGAKYYVTRNKVGTKFRVAVVNKLPVAGVTVRPSSAINGDSKRQVEIYATSKYMIIQCEDEASFSELMVSLDSSTSYSPYREQLLTLLTPNGLPGIPVTSGGNYTDPSGQQWICDEVDLERGIYKKRVSTTVLTVGMVQSLSQSVNDYCVMISPPIDYKHTYGIRTVLMSNRFIYDKKSKYKGVIFGYGTQIRLYVDQNEIATLAAAKEFIEKNQTEIMYEVNESTETPLTPAELAAYKALAAYAPNTVVQASDGAGIKLDYQRDVNLVIKNLEDAIASMTTT